MVVMSESVLKKSIAVLSAGKTLLYPTDTVWGIGCDATNKSAVAKVYEIKQRAETKSLIILVSSYSMLASYVANIPEIVEEILDTATKPTTIIYRNPIGIASNCIAEDVTIAIRIVKNDFCKKLIERFGKPIVSTSANISGMATPKTFSEIDAAILDSVDYIVNLQQEKIATASSQILRITDTNEVVVIRE